MSALAFVKKQSIQFYFTDRDAPVVCAVPAEAVRDLEVVSEEALKQVLTKSLGAAPPHASVPVVIALSDELMFSQKASGEKEAEQVKLFAATVPFALVATAVVPLGSDRYLFSTNQELYEVIVRVLASLGYTSVMVLPWASMALAGIGQGAIDRVTIRRIFDNTHLLRPAGFPLTTRPLPEPASGVPVPKKAPAKVPRWMIILGAVALVYVIIMYVFFLRG